MKKLSLLTLSILTATLLSAQDGSIEMLNKLSANLIRHSDERPITFLQCDKNLYQAGTPIWFKIFLLNRTSLTPHIRPSIVYAELRNEQDSLIDQRMLTSSNNDIEGRFIIPPSLKEGRYYLQSFVPSQISETKMSIQRTGIYILNSNKPSLEKYTATSYFQRDYQPPSGITFYPEGQQLIQGIDNLVAVTSFDPNGSPITGKGRILDQRDSVIAQFEIDASGISSFRMSPLKLKRYKCLFISNNGVKTDKELPPVAQRAYQLALMSETNDQIQFRIGLSDQLYTEKPSSYLLGLARGKIVFAAAGKGMYAVSVSKTDLPQGPVDFYLYDEKENLVSQRTVWNDKAAVTINMKSDKANYFPRANANLSFQLTDRKGAATRALLAVSITDSALVPEQVNTWWEQVLLKDYPSLLYFRYRSSNASKGKDREALLTVTASHKAATIEQATPENDNNGIQLSGWLRNGKKEPEKAQAITLVSEQGNIILIDTTDQNGRFRMMPTQIYEGIGFIPSINKGNNLPSDWTIELDGIPTFKNEGHAGVQMVSFSGEKQQELAERFRKTHADSIQSVSGAKWREAIFSGTDPGTKKKTPKKSGFTRTITREQLSKLELSNTANAVMMIPGVIMQGGKLTIRGGTPTLDPTLPANIEPLVILDDVPVNLASGTLVDFLNSIPPDNIEYIEVFMDGDAALYATRALNGVIRIKTGLPTNKNRVSSGASKIYPQGFHAAPDFKGPDYSNEKIKELAIRDNRATIYWNGHILTDGEGKSAFAFFTADANTTYRVTVTGISSKGEPIHETFWIKRNF